ncbi:MAG: TadE/TadG family type IV pilus assembly protein [Lentisphaeria bacterium]
MKTAIRRRSRDDGGSVMLESVLALPVLFLLILGCAQIAHLWVARQVVCYAAWCAARSALVCHQGEYEAAGRQAAQQVLAWLVIGQGQGEPEKRIPGWGKIDGSGAVARKTRTQVVPEGQWNVKATVEFDFALIMPVAGPVIGWAVSPWRESQEWLETQADPTGNQHRQQDTVQYPHLIFRETAVACKPYVTLPKTGLPAAGW